MKISARLTLAFSIMTALIIALGVIAGYKIAEVQSEFAKTMDSDYPNVIAVHQLMGTNNSAVQALLNLFIVTDPSDIKAQNDIFDDSGKRGSTSVEMLKKTLTTSKDRELFERFLTIRTDYRVTRDKIIAMLRSGQKEPARLLFLAELQPKQVAYINSLQDLIVSQNELMRNSGLKAARAADTTKYSVITLVAAAFCLAVALGFWIVRSTTKPINEAAKIAGAVAAGDLAMSFVGDDHNETGRLLKALLEMQTRLAAIVSNVRSNAESVATASAKIAHGNNDLSERTEQQAAALEETAAAMEQLSSTVRQNADNARQASELATSASSTATAGGAAVAQVIDTMKDINESSQKIAAITGLIDSIAFQTNILALNAAVEAARAGEQGRGFAVVATEVRSLAHRSAHAAKEIKVLVDASLDRVTRGTTLVDQAGSTMTAVVTSIQHVTDIVREISAASQEQSQGVAQVTEAVTKMDQATQQNAALVEQSATAASNLMAQAQQLVDAVVIFKLKPTASFEVQALR